MDINAINLDCVICLEVATEAMECQECACIMCKMCSIDLKSCPLCRKTKTIKESAFARKMINNMPSECKQCGFKATICDLKYHQVKCPLREIRCGYKECTFKGIHLDFIQHISAYHEKALIDYFDASLNNASDSVMFENGMKSFKMQASTFLYTFSSLNTIKSGSIKILIKRCKSPGHVCVGFSDKRICIAKGYLGGTWAEGIGPLLEMDL